MAKYILIERLNMFTYALDECEGYLVLDAYLSARDSGRFRNEKHLKVFEYYHMQDGATLNDNILLRLNGYLRLLGRRPLTFVNGHTTTYAALRGQDKVLRRQNMLERLSSLTPESRSDFISKKELEASRLPERKSDLPNRAPTQTVGELSRSEIERRRTALASAQKADARFEMPSVSGRMPPASMPASSSIPHAANAPDNDREFVPESTVEDNVVELIAEMQELRNEVASLKSMLQAIFKNV